jgi:hypothetical protein
MGYCSSYGQKAKHDQQFGDKCTFRIFLHDHKWSRVSCDGLESFRSNENIVRLFPMRYTDYNCSIMHDKGIPDDKKYRSSDTNEL